MTQQLNLFSREPLSTVPEGRLDGADVMLRQSEGNRPPILTDELDAAATQVRTHFRNMSAAIIEIGRELSAVKRRLKRSQFPLWTAARDVALGQAQRMMRAAGWAEGKEEIVSHLHPTAIYLLAAPSTPEAVRKHVLFCLEAGERPALRAIKALIRAAKGDPYGALPDSEEDAIEGLLKYCGYKGIPEHLAQFPKRPTKRTQLAAYQNVPIDAEFTTPVSAAASLSATEAGSEEITNVL